MIFPQAVVDMTSLQYCLMGSLCIQPFLSIWIDSLWSVLFVFIGQTLYRVALSTVFILLSVRGHDAKYYLVCCSPYIALSCSLGNWPWWWCWHCLWPASTSYILASDGGGGGWYWLWFLAIGLLRLLWCWYLGAAFHPGCGDSPVVFVACVR